MLRRLHDEHAVALSNFVTGLLGGDRAAAQDVVQETFLRAWRSPAVLDPSAGSPRGWLFTVARHIVIDQYRALARHPVTIAEDVPERPVPDETEHIVDRQLIRDALRTLSPEHRAVLVECYFRGATIAEAARTLAIAPGTVKSRTHYALHALRDAMDELGGTR